MPAKTKTNAPIGPTEFETGDNAGAIPQHMRKFRPARKPKAAPPEASLIGVHSLTEGNLAHAHDLGGLAAPSLAVTDRQHGMDNFGEVTLVAPHHLIDPAQHPVFDSDIYSPRHPSTEHEVNEKELAKIRKWLAPHVEKTGGYVGDLSDKIKKDGAEGPAQGGGGVKHALAAAWLEEQGHHVQPVMKVGDIDHRYEWVKQPAFREFLKQHPQDPNESYNSPAQLEYHRAMSEAAKQAVRQRGEELARETGDPTDAGDYEGRILENYFDDGLLHGGAVSGACRAAEGMDATTVDKYATQEAIDAKVGELGKDAFQHWAAQKLAPAQGKAYIPRHVDTANGPTIRKIPYTLENVLKEVTRKVRNGEGFSYGLGNARSMGAKRFRSLDDVKAARGKIVSHEEFEKLKKENDDRFGALVDKLSRYHNDPTGFRVLDSAAGAIGESFQRGKSLYKQLEENGFRGVPPELRREVGDFAADLVAMPTEYFEAKPQRVVGLHEFQGAAIPHDASPRTREILRHHGIQHVEEYPRGDPKARAAAVERVARSRDLMLSEVEDLEKAQDPEDPYVYHVTYHGRLPGIAAEGLRPDAGRGIGTAAYDGNRKGQVFVTGSQGAFHWHGLAQNHSEDRFEHPLHEGGVPVILRTPRKGLGLRPDAVANRESISSDAHKTTRTIPPERIQVYGGKGWIPVQRHDEVPVHEAVRTTDDGTSLQHDSPLFPHELHPSYRPPAPPKPATQVDVARHKALTTKGARVTTKHWGSGEVVKEYLGPGHAPVVYVKLDNGGEMGMNIAHVEPEMAKAEVEDLEKAVYHKTSTATKKNGQTYQTHRWVQGPNPTPEREPHHLGDAPMRIPEIEAPPARMEPIEPVSGYGYVDNGKPRGTAPIQVDRAAEQVSRHLPAVAGSIARSLSGAYPDHMADASDPEVRHSDVGDDIMGTYDRPGNKINLSSKAMHGFYEALAGGRGWDGANWGAAKTFVHEALHHASNKFQYENYEEGKSGDMKYRPHAALEEATTETLAQHLAPHVMKDLLGMKIEGDNGQKPSLGDLPAPTDKQRAQMNMKPTLTSQLAKPLFQRVEDPYGNGDEWEIGEGQAPSYRNFVKRFANLVGYADDLHKNPNLTNKEFSDHVAKRALEVKQRPQVGSIDHRWDALTNKVLEKFDLPAQYEHWISKSGRPSGAASEHEQQWDAERKKRWDDNIRYGVKVLLHNYLTGEGHFHPDKHGTHIGALEDAVKAMVEDRGNVPGNDWKPRVKKGFIGHVAYDQEGRRAPERQPQKPQSLGDVASIMQDAYHYADHATGDGDAGFDISRGEAMRKSIKAARLAGYPIERVPTKLADMAEFRDKLEDWAGEQGINAPRGIIMKEGDKEIHLLNKEIFSRIKTHKSMAESKEKQAAEREIKKLREQRDVRERELYHAGKMS